MATNTRSCSRAVRRSKNALVCSWTPMRGSSPRFRGQDGMPRTTACPVSGRRSPSTISSVVVLPAPFGPRMAEDLARLDGERHVLDGDEVAVALPEAVGHDRGARAAAGALWHRVQCARALSRSTSLAPSRRPCCRCRARRTRAPRRPRALPRAPASYRAESARHPRCACPRCRRRALPGHCR